MRTVSIVVYVGSASHRRRSSRPRRGAKSLAGRIQGKPMSCVGVEFRLVSREVAGDFKLQFEHIYGLYVLVIK